MRRRVIQNCLQKKRTRSDIEAPTRQISVSDRWSEEILSRYQAVGAYCIRPPNVPAREQKTLWPNLFGIDLDNRLLPKTPKGRMQYAPTPVHPIYFFHPHMYPAKFPGLGEALIFFCFFSSIKGRKEDNSRAEKTPILGIDYSYPTKKHPRGVCNTPLQPTGRWVSHSAIRHDVKPGGFWTLPHDMT